MSLMKQTLTIEIVYNDEAPSPVTWDWEELLDLSPDENVTIISSTTPEEVDN